MGCVLRVPPAMAPAANRGVFIVYPVHGSDVMCQLRQATFRTRRDGLKGCADTPFSLTDSGPRTHRILACNFELRCSPLLELVEEVPALICLVYTDFPLRGGDTNKEFAESKGRQF